MQLMKKLILAASCLALVVSGAGAVDTLAVHQDSLANGLKILTVEKPGLPLVSFQVWYRVGSRNERPGITGISHLLEHMMFKGTDRIGPEEFSRIVQKYGGHSNAFTSQDYTAYYENISTEFLSVAMGLESDRMANLKLDPKEFSPERNVVKEERRLRENSPYGRLFEELSAAAYTAHPYGWPVLGWMTDIEAITPQDLRDYYRIYYAPNNAACVIVGAVNRKEAVALVDKYFGGIPRNKTSPPRVTTIEPPQMGERRVKVLKDTRMPLVAMGYHTPEIGQPDTYALELLSNILSNGESSRLYRSLVYDKQLALFAGGYNDTQTDPTLFIFYSAPLKGHNTEELEQAITEELEKIKRDGVSPRELQKSKNQLEADFIFQQQRNNGLAVQIGSAQTRLSWRYLNSYLKNIRAVSNQDIISVANKYFIDQNRTVATLIPTGGPQNKGEAQ
jgi:zinc protease